MTIRTNSNAKIIFCITCASFNLAVYVYPAKISYEKVSNLDSIEDSILEKDSIKNSILEKDILEKEDSWKDSWNSIPKEDSTPKRNSIPKEDSWNRTPRRDSIPKNVYFANDLQFVQRQSPSNTLASVLLYSGLFILTMGTAEVLNRYISIFSYIGVITSFIAPCVFFAKVNKRNRLLHSEFRSIDQLQAEELRMNLLGHAIFFGALSISGFAPRSVSLLNMAIILSLSIDDQQIQNIGNIV